MQTSGDAQLAKERRQAGAKLRHALERVRALLLDGEHAAALIEAETGLGLRTTPAKPTETP